MAGRQREKTPDPNTPEGMWAIHLEVLLRNQDIDELAEAIGKDRSMVFKWLRGDNVPKLHIWDKIAKSIGLKDWRALVPSDTFAAAHKRLYKK